MLRDCKKHVQGLKEQLFSARNPKAVEATYQKRASKYLRAPYLKIMLSGLILFLPSSHMSSRILFDNNFDYTEFLESLWSEVINAFDRCIVRPYNYNILKNAVVGLD